jgi:hypothetical protein
VHRAQENVALTITIERIGITAGTQAHFCSLWGKMLQLYPSAREWQTNTI